MPCDYLQIRSAAVSTFQHIPEVLTYMGQTLQHHQKWLFQHPSSGAKASSMTFTVVDLLLSPALEASSSGVRLPLSSSLWTTCIAVSAANVRATGDRLDLSGAV